MEKNKTKSVNKFRIHRRNIFAFYTSPIFALYSDYVPSMSDKGQAYISIIVLRKPIWQTIQIFVPHWFLHYIDDDYKLIAERNHSNSHFTSYLLSGELARIFVDHIGLAPSWLEVRKLIYTCCGVSTPGAARQTLMILSNLNQKYPRTQWHHVFNTSDRPIGHMLESLVAYIRRFPHTNSVDLFPVVDGLKCYRASYPNASGRYMFDTVSFKTDKLAGCTFNCQDSGILDMAFSETYETDVLTNTYSNCRDRKGNVYLGDDELLDDPVSWTRSASAEESEEYIESDNDDHSESSGFDDFVAYCTEKLCPVDHKHDSRATTCRCSCDSCCPRLPDLLEEDDTELKNLGFSDFDQQVTCNWNYFPYTPNISYSDLSRQDTKKANWLGNPCLEELIKFFACYYIGYYFASLMPVLELIDYMLFGVSLRRRIPAFLFHILTIIAYTYFGVNALPFCILIHVLYNSQCDSIGVVNAKAVAFDAAEDYCGVLAKGDWTYCPWTNWYSPANSAASMSRNILRHFVDKARLYIRCICDSSILYSWYSCYQRFNSVGHTLPVTFSPARPPPTHSRKAEFDFKRFGGYICSSFAFFYKACVETAFILVFSGLWSIIATSYIRTRRRDPIATLLFDQFIIFGMGAVYAAICSFLSSLFFSSLIFFYLLPIPWAIIPFFLLFWAAFAMSYHLGILAFRLKRFKDHIVEPRPLGAHISFCFNGDTYVTTPHLYNKLVRKDVNDILEYYFKSVPTFKLLNELETDYRNGLVDDLGISAILDLWSQHVILNTYGRPVKCLTKYDTATFLKTVNSEFDYDVGICCSVPALALVSFFFSVISREYQSREQLDAIDIAYLLFNSKVDVSRIANYFIVDELVQYPWTAFQGYYFPTVHQKAVIKAFCDCVDGKPCKYHDKHISRKDFEFAVNKADDETVIKLNKYLDKFSSTEERIGQGFLCTDIIYPELKKIPKGSLYPNEHPLHVLNAILHAAGADFAITVIKDDTSQLVEKFEFEHALMHHLSLAAGGKYNVEGYIYHENEIFYASIDSAPGAWKIVLNRTSFIASYIAYFDICFLGKCRVLQKDYYTAKFLRFSLTMFARFANSVRKFKRTFWAGFEPQGLIEKQKTKFSLIQPVGRCDVGQPLEVLTSGVNAECTVCYEEHKAFLGDSESPTIYICPECAKRVAHYDMQGKGDRQKGRDEKLGRLDKAHGRNDLGHDTHKVRALKIEVENKEEKKREVVDPFAEQSEKDIILARKAPRVLKRHAKTGLVAKNEKGDLGLYFPATVVYREGDKKRNIHSREQLETLTLSKHPEVRKDILKQYPIFTDSNQRWKRLNLDHAYLSNLSAKILTTDLKGDFKEADAKTLTNSSIVNLLANSRISFILTANPAWDKSNPNSWVYRLHAVQGTPVKTDTGTVMPVTAQFVNFLNREAAAETDRGERARYITDMFDFSDDSFHIEADELSNFKSQFDSLLIAYEEYAAPSDMTLQSFSQLGIRNKLKCGFVWNLAYSHIESWIVLVQVWFPKTDFSPVHFNDPRDNANGWSVSYAFCVNQHSIRPDSCFVFKGRSVSCSSEKITYLAHIQVSDFVFFTCEDLRGDCTTTLNMCCGQEVTFNNAIFFLWPQLDFEINASNYLEASQHVNFNDTIYGDREQKNMMSIVPLEFKSNSLIFQAIGTKKGDCGSPIIIMVNGVPKLLSIHTASNECSAFCIHFLAQSMPLPLSELTSSALLSG